MTTIKDIAREANCSVTTVSRVLSNDQTLSITEETRNRVMEVTAKLGYRLRRKKTTASQHHEPQQPRIGLLIWCSTEWEFEDPYFLSIREGVEMQFAELGIALPQIIRYSAQSSEIKLDDLDGIIVIGVAPEDLHHMFSRKDRVVFINNSPNDDVYDSVISDFVPAVEKVMDHLFSLGYRDIGFVGGMDQIHQFGQPSEEVKESRLLTYERIMKEKGLYKPENVFITEWTISASYNLMKEIIKKGELPEAFFFANDPMAIGALKAFQESDISVPDDVAMVGFDDIKMASYINPTLTTVKVHTEQMGRSAVNLMMERIRGRSMPVKTCVPTTFIIRESCGKSRH